MKKTCYLLTGLMLVCSYALSQNNPDALPAKGHERAKLGNLSFTEFFTQRTQYPLNAVRQNIEGIVVLSFEIDSAGNIDKLEIVENPNSLLSLEAVMSLQKSEGLWVPAKLNGRNINESYLAIYSFLTKATKENYEAHQSRAAKFLEKGKYEQALKAIDKALAINSYDPKVLQMKAITYAKREEYELSKETVDRIQELNKKILFKIDLFIYTVIRTTTVR